MGARDRGELVIEYAGERKQIVALVFQRRAHRPDPARIVRLAPFHLGYDEIEHLVANVQARAGQCQDIVGELSGECSDVAGQRMRSRFGLAGERAPFDKV